MLIYIALIYVVFRITYFLIAHRGKEKGLLLKMINFLILEIVLVIVGVIGVGFIFSGGGGEKFEWIHGAFIIGGVICLIASGRVGIYIRKLAKGTAAEISDVNPISKKQFTLAKILSFVSFLSFIFAWPFFQALSKAPAVALYLISLILGIVSIRYGIKSKIDLSTKKASIWGLILFNSIIATLAIFMLLGIAMKISA